MVDSVLVRNPRDAETSTFCLFHNPDLVGQPVQEIRLLMLGLEARFWGAFWNGRKSELKPGGKALLLALKRGEILADGAQLGVLLLLFAVPAVFAVRGGVAQDPADEDEDDSSFEAGEDGTDHAVFSITDWVCSFSTRWTVARETR